MKSSPGQKGQSHLSLLSYHQHLDKHIIRIQLWVTPLSLQHFSYTFWDALEELKMKIILKRKSQLPLESKGPKGSHLTKSSKEVTGSSTGSILLFMFYHGKCFLSALEQQIHNTAKTEKIFKYFKKLSNNQHYIRQKFLSNELQE